MTRRSNPKNLYSIFYFILAIGLLHAFSASAQEFGAEAENDSVRTFKDLGRRSKIKLEHLGEEADTIHIGINLDSGLGIVDAFFASFSMILVSEIGDETFIIGALMAMRHPKSIVLSGALSAFILSTGLGRIVPNLISRKHTSSAATVLYCFFGLRLLYIAWRSDSKAAQKEMEERRNWRLVRENQLFGVSFPGFAHQYFWSYQLTKMQWE